MEKEQQDGYIAGIFSLLIATMFLAGIGGDVLAQSNRISLVIGGLFGLLGAGSIWKPTTIGQVTKEILRRLNKAAEDKPRRKKQQKVKTIHVHANRSQVNVGDKNKIEISK